MSKIRFGPLLLVWLLAYLLSTFFARWEGGWLAADLDLSLKLAFFLSLIFFMGLLVMGRGRTIR
jgi:hypothetical protein